MSRVYISMVFDFSVQANWTAYANGVHTAITSTLGWVQTSDTGQIVPATQTLPASNTYAGYCIYRTNDGIGSTFYIKIQYGRSSSIRHPKTQFSIGTGTDGAGNLTGNVSAVFDVVAPLNDTGALTLRMLVAGNAGQLCFIGNMDFGTPSSWVEAFLITRSVGSNGLPNSNGMECWMWPGSNFSQQFIPATAYSTVVWDWESVLGIIPVQGTRRSWTRDGMHSYFAHPVNGSAVASQYPNPQMVIMYDGYQGAAWYNITSYGTSRKYWMHDSSLIAGTNGGTMGFCID